ncbi:MAG: hypothetical protein KF770_10100 [Anaerolineae bacterium]|nr:hypothetical protein [Anaerolineae bacterium]
MADQMVDAQGLKNFLERLGSCFRYTARLYLVGGASLLLAGGKTSTFDIDIHFDVTPEVHAEFIRCLRQIRRELHLPIEEASPGEFIPLPTGYADRHQYIGRYGQIEVFHFDFYAVALSKIHRGNEKDFADVSSMVNRQLIDFVTLESFFNDLLPRYESYGLKADPDLFQRKFDLLRQRL